VEKLLIRDIRIRFPHIWSRANWKAWTKWSSPKHVRQLQWPSRKIEGLYPTIVIYTCCLLIVSLSRGNRQRTS